MPTYKAKNDPIRVRNWLRRAKVRQGDFLRLSTMQLVGGAAQVIGLWDGRESAGEHTDEELAEDIISACQDHCDQSSRGKGEYNLELVRNVKGVEQVRVSFEIRCIAAEYDGDDEHGLDASPEGQVLQQMRHAEVLMRMSVKGPMMAIEALGMSLREAHARIRELEKERAAMLDREIAVLELAAELQATQREMESEPKESLTDAIIKSAVGDLAPHLPKLLMGLSQ
jgi:hypothetical protein